MLTMWTKSGFTERFGVAFNNGRDCLLAMNGDAAAQGAKIMGTWYKLGDVGCFMEGHETGSVRLNYVIVIRR